MIEEPYRDLDRLAAVLDLRCAELECLGVGELALHLVTSQLRTLARRLKGTADALYAHACLCQS